MSIASLRDHDHDADAAAATMRTHLRRARERLLSALPQSAPAEAA